MYLEVKRDIEIDLKNIYGEKLKKVVLDGSVAKGTSSVYYSNTSYLKCSYEEGRLLD